jgi:hypothetical protein
MKTKTQKHNVYESGHGKNVANFNQLITLLITFAAKYSPTNPLITIAAMQTVYNNCYNVMEQFSTDLVSYVLSVDARQDAYDLMASYATRALNMLKGSGATPRQIEDAKATVKKLRSQGKKTIAQAPVQTTPALTADELGKAPDAGSELAKILKHSVSQLSFDNRIIHFKDLIKLLSAIPVYNPNETDLKIASLNTYTASLQTLNNNANVTGSAVQKNRISRDELLYDPKTGLIEVAREAKNYVKGACGATSPEYKDVVKIKFHDYK